MRLMYPPLWLLRRFSPTFRNFVESRLGLLTEVQDLFWGKIVFIPNSTTRKRSMLGTNWSDVEQIFRRQFFHEPFSFRSILPFQRILKLLMHALVLFTQTIVSPGINSKKVSRCLNSFWPTFGTTVALVILLTDSWVIGSNFRSFQSHLRRTQFAWMIKRKAVDVHDTTTDAVFSGFANIIHLGKKYSCMTSSKNSMEYSSPMDMSKVFCARCLVTTCSVRASRKLTMMLSKGCLLMTFNASAHRYVGVLVNSVW